MTFFLVRLVVAWTVVHVVSQDIAADIGGLPIGTLTPAGLLAVVILLIAMGRLVPRRTMEDVIHDRNEWRAAHRISETARQQQEESLRELLDGYRSLDAYIRAIPSGAQEASRSTQQKE